MAARPNFDEELKRLLRKAPDWARRMMKAAARPDSIWRAPLALGLIIGGVLGFLPVLGFWMLPLGLALLAVDLPFLRHPLARFLAWINRRAAQT
jgi:hypothetical protein